MFRHNFIYSRMKLCLLFHITIIKKNKNLIRRDITFLSTVNLWERKISKILLEIWYTLKRTSLSDFPRKKFNQFLYKNQAFLHVKYVVVHLPICFINFYKYLAITLSFSIMKFYLLSSANKNEKKLKNVFKQCIALNITYINSLFRKNLTYIEK